MAGFAVVIPVGRRSRALHQDGVQAHQALQQGLARLHRARQLRGTCDHHMTHEASRVRLFAQLQVAAWISQRIMSSYAELSIFEYLLRFRNVYQCFKQVQARAF